MKLTEIHEWLTQNMPDFEFIPGTDTPHEENWNSILIKRDGQQLILDVSKVDNKKALKKLKEYIEAKWKQVVV